ncbi:MULTISPECIES: hypothetical protein [unclassified Roseibium]
MNKRSEEMSLSSVGLLLLLTAAAMTLFADFGPLPDSPAHAREANQIISY